MEVYIISVIRSFLFIYFPIEIRIEKCYDITKLEIL
nr:MAG TPA: hypothetical protein [Caudoviricetes sp.]